MKLGLERNEQAVGVLLACSGARRVKEKPLFLKLNKGEATSSWIFFKFNYFLDLAAQLARSA